MLISLLRQLFRRTARPDAGYEAPDGLDLLPDARRLLDAAIAHLKNKNYAAAAALCEDLLEHDPGFAGAQEVLGLVALETGEDERACRCFDAALEATARQPRTLSNAAEMHRRAGHFDVALRLCDEALAMAPSHAPALHSRALTLESCWRMDEALQAYRQAIVADPDFKRANTGYLFFLLRSGAPLAEVLRAHRAWSARAYPAVATVRHSNRPDPERKLRIAYVSADLRDHAAAAFIAPVLQGHDRNAFHVTCYSNNGRDDGETGNLRALSDAWRDVRSLKDAALAQQIRADGIDIMVDLSGMSVGNRLGTFALQPAPLQVTWLGYPGTLGMAAVGYRLTDAFADPPGVDCDYSEQLVRMRCLWCFQPPPGMPPVSPLPAMSTGQVTFASPNSMLKLAPRTVALWSRLLREVDRSRLVLATVPQSEARARLLAEFEKNGVAPERVTFAENTGRRGFWSLLEGVDIALDSFPCNGGATTSETLWMGVPVISLSGNVFVSRAGLSLLNNAGFPEWVAASEEQFIEKAKALAADLPALERVRHSLRDRLLSSPLLDQRGFVAELERRYRDIWQAWCQRIDQ